MSAVAVGSKVPRFAAATTGGEFRLGARPEGSLVLYFYPRDNTPGCTTEGSDFRDLAPQFRRARTTILGVSTDSLESHRRFRDSIDVTLGDRQARLQLIQPEYDRELVAAGFVRGRNDPDDVDGMIALFRWLHWYPSFASAVEIWRQGDLLIDGYDQL